MQDDRKLTRFVALDGKEHFNNSQFQSHFMFGHTSFFILDLGQIRTNFNVRNKHGKETVRQF